VAETSAISESIAILERYSSSLHQDVNRTLGELTRTQPRDRTDAPPTSGAPRPRRSALAAVLDPLPGAQVTEAPAPNPELARLTSQLSAKQDELSKLESARQQALSEAQARLAAMQAQYTASHPSVQNAQQNVTALQRESPQIVALRTEIDDLETKHDELAAAVEAHRAEQDTANQRAATPRVAEVSPEREPFIADTPAPAPRPSQVTEFANLRLRTELGQLQSILERTDGARIELAVSEAAFKYRYTVIKPAQVPREPESPNLRLILIAGLLAAVLLSVAAAVASDLISNRIHEPWQVERQLGLPILGSVRLA
jgi:septal ring factor EnvC (AmiA/AmiB activator)